MEEKAELLVNPGCKAGSEFCGECKSLDTSWPTCGCYPDEEIERNFDDESCEMFYKRCKSCLEAEVQLKELREKVERFGAVERKIVAMRDEARENYCICLENCDDEGAAHFDAVSATLIKVLLEM